VTLCVTPGRTGVHPVSPEDGHHPGLIPVWQYLGPSAYMQRHNIHDVIHKNQTKTTRYNIHRKDRLYKHKGDKNRSQDEQRTRRSEHLSHLPVRGAHLISEVRMTTTSQTSKGRDGSRAGKTIDRLMIQPHGRPGQQGC
jgi:hypothetical protein